MVTWSDEDRLCALLAKFNERVFQPVRVLLFLPFRLLNFGEFRYRQLGLHLGGPSLLLCSHRLPLCESGLLGSDDGGNDRPNCAPGRNENEEFHMPP